MGSVIRLVEATPLEKHPRPAGDHTPSLGLSAFRTFFDGLIDHGLEFLKPMAARLAFIFIGRHKTSLLLENAL
jgi:hypothetical protein